MFCRYCGSQLPEDARFCAVCGQSVEGVPGAAGPPPDYPARLEIDYPDRPLDRLTTFFRAFTAIPILILIAMVTGAPASVQAQAHGARTFAFAGGGVLVGPVVLMLLFRKKYPGWWFDSTRFSNRVGAYVALLDDRYPSTDEQQSVHIQIDRPNAEQLSRGLPLVKWLLALPHYFVLFFLGIAAFFVIVFAWFAILITGHYPRGAFDFVVGVFRWSLRVNAYAFLLTTDRYPPFQLSP